MAIPNIITDASHADLPAAIKRWGPIVNLLTREAALILFGVVCAGWIVWMDVRPFVRERLKKRKGTYVAAMLELSWDPHRGHALPGSGSKNVEHAERRDDGSWVVQFQERVDPETLTVRSSWSEQKLELMEKTPRQARVRAVGQASLDQLYSYDPFQLIFECAEYY